MFIDQGMHFQIACDRPLPQHARPRARARDRQQGSGGDYAHLRWAVLSIEVFRRDEAQHTGDLEAQTLQGTGASDLLCVAVRRRAPGFTVGRTGAELESGRLEFQRTARRYERQQPTPSRSDDAKRRIRSFLAAMV